jgi:hypothetical protein
MVKGDCDLSHIIIIMEKTGTTGRFSLSRRVLSRHGYIANVQSPIGKNRGSNESIHNGPLFVKKLQISAAGSCFEKYLRCFCSLSSPHLSRHDKPNWRSARIMRRVATSHQTSMTMGAQASSCSEVTNVTCGMKGTGYRSVNKSSIACETYKQLQPPKSAPHSMILPYQ